MKFSPMTVVPAGFFAGGFAGPLAGGFAGIFPIGGPFAPGYSWGAIASSLDAADSSSRTRTDGVNG